MSELPYGYIMLARKLRDSEIWHAKPAWWLKVWVYILMEVNHKTNPQFARGTNFFSYQDIYYKCRLSQEGVKQRAISNLVHYLKKATMIRTRKTTRGLVITVCNYEKYQNPIAYTKDTENDTEKDNRMKQKRHRNDTINNKGNNGKNVKNDLLPKGKGKKPRNPDLQSVIDHALTLNFGVQGSQKKNRQYAWILMNKKDERGLPLGADRLKEWVSLAVAVRGEPYAPQINNFQTLFNKWQDLHGFVRKHEQGGRIG